jgi:hypothetical protein
MPNDQAAPAPRPAMIHRIRNLFGRREESLRDRVEELIEAEREAPGEETNGRTLDPHERALLSNVLKLRGATAYDVMLPRADIIALPADLSFDQALDFIKREGHSRYPVYAGQLDDVVGMVHIKDIIAQLGRSRASRCARCCASRCWWCPPCPCSTCCCACARSACTWRWWWTSTAASTASSPSRTSSRPSWATSRTSMTSWPPPR